MTKVLYRLIKTAGYNSRYSFKFSIFILVTFPSMACRRLSKTLLQNQDYNCLQ